MAEINKKGKPTGPITRQLVTSLAAIASLGALLTPTVSNANPLFARQTGLQCASCHFGGSFPELTAIGRDFKLMGYTAGNRQTIPLAGMLQAGLTKMNNTNGSSNPASDFPHDDAYQLQQASLFTGGKITNNLGAFVQWTYNGVGHHSSADNMDFRFADKTKADGKDLIYGVTLNNNPAVQDLSNATPAWKFPTAGPGGAFQNYGATTQIDGGLSAKVVGAGAYVDWNHFIYAELSGYRNADGIFSFMRAGTDIVGNPDGVRYAVSGTNPYWRLALHGDSGPHSWSVGTYGTTVDAFSNAQDASSPTDRYKDNALDGQYQYTDGKNKWSAQATWIHEKADWNVNAGNSNSSDTLDTRRLKGSYFYNNKVGGSVAYFSTTGSQDAIKYGDNASGTPDTQGYILEVNYLPVQKVRLALQYTAYNKFNGSSSNYASAGAATPLPGRNASDNNTWFLSTWFLF